MAGHSADIRITGDVCKFRCRHNHFGRTIRVGDIVTVDDVTGVVSRIRNRATSITNWDRKEYVVPNKESITGRLLNWPLSDKVNRILIEDSHMDQAPKVHAFYFFKPPTIILWS